MSKATELADKLEEDPSMWGGLSKVAWPAAGELRRLDAENARMRKGAERVPGKMPLFEQHQGANYGESHEEGYINGWNACVDAMLAAAPQPTSAQPVAQPEQTALEGEPVATLIDHYGFTDGLVRFYGVENMEPLPIGTQFFTHPQPERAALTDEQDRALCEAHCNDASDEYFKARTQLESDVNRRVFYAGWLSGIKGGKE